MGQRRKARELALKALFDWDFTNNSPRIIMDHLVHDYQPEPEVLQYAQALIETFSLNQMEIDKEIEAHASNWKLARMASVDRNIIRLGVTEILHMTDIPKTVTINECLEVAKKYGTADSPLFINGVLDSFDKIAS